MLSSSLGLAGGAGEIGFDRVQQGGGQVGGDRGVELHEIAEDDRGGRADIGADVAEVALGLPPAAGAMVVDDGRRDDLPAAGGCRRRGAGYRAG